MWTKKESEKDLTELNKEVEEKGKITLKIKLSSG